MTNWYIYLECQEQSGYYVSLNKNSDNTNVIVDSNKKNAYVFTSRDAAITIAKTLKNRCKSIISYNIVNK